MYFQNQDDCIELNTGPLSARITSVIIDSATSALNTIGVEETMEKAWKLYVTFAKKNRAKLVLADSVLDRALWWVLPGTARVPLENYQETSEFHPNQQQTLQQSQAQLSSSPPQQQQQYQYWRAIIWAIVSLHRLALDIALQDGESDIWETDGTTLQLPHDKLSFRMRLALTMIQSLWPLCSHCCSNAHQEASWRRILERMRFAMRAGLLLRYWKRVNVVDSNLVPGLLQVGGLLGCAPPGAPTAFLEQLEQERHAYVGRRTGRRVMTASTRRQRRQERYANGQNQNGGELEDEAPCTNNSQTNIRLILGEALYILRPLFWAEVQVAHTDPNRAPQSDATIWNAWLLSLGLDIASLVSLHGIVTRQKRNTHTTAEWQRRRVRLMFYLLRSPVWDRLSSPTIRRANQILEYLPILGNFLSLYLQDWVYFWKEYRLEDC
eukprot:CAMPEP_0172470044 /NCGR_PEP_ID=MMETSP1065-20121228/65317_1 /TAXON_ID=265537 /ORGANISM="Amphiprora paludosa, Strain CCMP125" /LENGTH=436 /DNA_ID=CAMNT_0013227869 /DNA_START=197 /DNA_END=1507 /DNA_ORIENTATION=-